MLVRRRFLKIAAAATAVLGGAAAWRAWDQRVFSTGEGPAYEPWKTWRAGDARSPRRPVRAAILAASPHNTQPWRFRIGSEDIDLFADRSRNIGTIDPFLREMHIGLGCALENLLLAAAAEGFEPRLALFPDSADATHVARVRLQPAEARISPLFEAIPRRHTNRGAYDTGRALEPSVFEELQALGRDLPLVSVKWFSSPEARAKVGELIVQATEAIVDDREQSRDSGAWLRASRREVEDKRDGLTVDAQGMPAWMRIGAKMLPPVSPEQSDRFWLKATREVHVATAAAYGFLVARDAADNSNRVEGGRFWQRMHLWAESRGIAMQPLNQLPERADRERSLGIEPRFGDALADLLGAAGRQTLMPFRLGYPTAAALASPRRRIEEVILA